MLGGRPARDDPAVRNWSGTYEYRAAGVHRPRTLEALRAIVAAAPRIRVLGSRHSFTGVADSDELVSLEALPADVVVDRAAGTVSFGAGLRYGDLAQVLERERLALHNLASLPHISVAGAVATATHGSGDASGNLATAVRGLELATSGGELLSAVRGDGDFDGMVVGLGALGAVTRITLDVEPAYAVRQRAFEGMSWDALLAGFDEVTAAGEHVSVFSRWGEAVEQVWVKTRVTGEPERIRADLLGAPAATVDRHPILGLDPVNATPQLGAAGPWWDRLPHFRMGFTPSAGAEIQSEYLVPRRDAVAAIEAMLGLSEAARALIQVAEIRTMAADRLWLSPQYGRDTIGLHFTWEPRPDAVRRAVAEVEAALGGLDARPHWGKLFLAEAGAIAPRYERLPDFVALMGRLDPRGAFRNDWLERHVVGPA
jgi:xylitol oxidase